jgi:hypothetical protein
MRDHDTNRDARENETYSARDAQKTRIHRVCVTCNNMFETDTAHIDAKYCPTCRRA